MILSRLLPMIALALAACSGWCPGEERQILLPVPELPSAPDIDGRLDAREWSCASMAGPLLRTSDGMAQNQTTSVFVGWKETVLYVGLRQRLSAGRVSVGSMARSAEELAETDHVSVCLRQPGKAERALLLWANKCFGQECETRITRTGWEAEIRMPVEQGTDECVLRVTRSEPSVGPERHSLRARLHLSKVPLAVRLVEAGEFTNGRYQGISVELVNFGAERIPCKLSVALRGHREVEEESQLRANRQYAFRASIPRRLGAFDASWQLEVSGSRHASGAFQFRGRGPIEVHLNPFLLWREGLFVLSEFEPEGETQVTASVETLVGKELVQSREAVFSEPGLIEQFVSLKGLDAGFYQLVVRATSNGKVPARRTRPFLRRSRPAWSKKRRRDDPIPRPVFRPRPKRIHVYPHAVEYPAGGHLNPREGTIEFWMRLERIADSRAEGGTHHFTLFYIDDVSERTMRVGFTYQHIWRPEHFHFWWSSRGTILGKESSNAYLTTVEDTQEKTKADRGRDRYPRVPRLKKGEWHHVAVTWRGLPQSTVTMYFDGRLVMRPRELEVPIMYDMEDCLFKLVPAPYKDNISIDELRISSVVRAAEEITATAKGDEPVQADIHTRLLDRFEEFTQLDGRPHTVAEVTSRQETSPGGRVTIPNRVQLVEGRFGKALKLTEVQR